MPDNYLANIATYCRKNLRDNFIALILYGSRIWGFPSQKSDYDLILLCKQKSRGWRQFQKQLKEQYPLSSLQYFLTPREALRMIHQGNWSLFLVLRKIGHVVSATKQYAKFSKKIAIIHIKKNAIRKHYRNYNNPRETKVLARAKGWKFTKWSYTNILKRLQILHYYQTGEIEDKHMPLITNLLAPEEKKLFLRLRRHVFRRTSMRGKTSKRQILHLHKKVSLLVEQ